MPAMDNEHKKHLLASRSFEERVFARFDTLDDRLDRVDARLDQVDGRLDRVEGKLEA